MGRQQRISDMDVREIRQLVNDGVHPSEVADAFGITLSYVHNLARGRARVAAGGVIQPQGSRRPKVKVVEEPITWPLALASIAAFAAFAVVATYTWLVSAP